MPIKALMIALTAGIASIMQVVHWEPSDTYHYDKTKYVYVEKEDDDLMNKWIVTTDDMAYLLERYILLYPDTALYGCAQAFIDASNETGYDPLFLMSLAGIESGWGSSKIHKSLNNPYSIGMYGDGVHNGIELGDSFYNGIINGAKYIYENYYLKGQTTLDSMNHVEGHSYCAGNELWEIMIEDEMKYLHDMLKNRSY